MKRKHHDEISIPFLSLLPELRLYVNSLLYESWFTDLRAFLRWHQCCSEYWNAYKSQSQSIIHYALTVKLAYAKRSGPLARTLSTAQECALLSRAVTQSALLVVIEEQLEKIPSLVSERKESQLTGKMSNFYLDTGDSINLETMVSLQGGTNAEAFDILTWCRHYIHTRYGWFMNLIYTNQTTHTPHNFPFPWQRSPHKKSKLRLAFSQNDLEQKSNVKPSSLFSAYGNFF